ncbi:MAG: hypothetical protein Q9162_000162 [Coniocarpon cinnabarinum]
MDAYLAATGAADEYEYQTSMPAFNMMPPSAMSWPPPNSSFAAMEGSIDHPSHLHHSQDPNSSSSSVPQNSQPIPAYSHHQTSFHQQPMPHSRPMMNESSWQYAAAAPTHPQLPPHHQQSSQPMMGHNPMLSQPQYGAQPFVHHGHAQAQQNQPVHHHQSPQSFQAQGLQPASIDFSMAQQHHHHQQQQQAALNQQYAMTSAAESRQYMPYTSSMEYGPLHVYQHDLHSGLSGYPMDHQQRMQQDQHYGQSPPFGQAGTLLGTSPESATFENQSSTGSECSWHMVEYPTPIQPRSSFESQYDMQPAHQQQQQATAVSNAGVAPQLLHLRTTSDATNPDNIGSASSNHSFGSYDDVGFLAGSPHSENSLELAVIPVQPTVMPATSAEHTTSPDHLSNASSSSSPTSPTVTSPVQSRKPAAKNTGTTMTKVVKKSVTQTKKAGDKEKRVGRRKGPLRPEQRAQASEIRKRRACLRCKYLKKTCDPGDPCAGCQPAHARLWQVPCTRMDIKEIGYFIKDWTADYQRHVTLGFSIANIRGYSPIERPLFVTHGFGFVLPITAREVFVRDEDCFNVDWVETNKEKPDEFETQTARLTAGIDGVSMPVLSDYIDKHIAEGFEKWVDQHFEGTLFLTEMLKTAHKYYERTKIPVIFKALKLIVAYNMTQHVTMVEGVSDEEGFAGKIDDENSKYFGKTLAPVMINFQVKHCLAMMWRELQREVLEELSALYSSVYSGEKLKNWPTIFMLATILLAVWEEIKFDAHYRIPDADTVKKFCDEMESTPVGVIVGLFQAISTKLPAFQEWDTDKHHQVLNSNYDICDTLTEVREHVLKYEEYLKKRVDCKFDRQDFDCLSSSLLARLVIRVN